MGAAFGALAGFVIYALVDKLLGLRLSAEDEQQGADLAVHKISANPEEERMGRVWRTVCPARFSACRAKLARSR